MIPCTENRVCRRLCNKTTKALIFRSYQLGTYKKDLQNRTWTCRVRSDHVCYCGSLNIRRFVVSSTIIRGHVIEKDGTNIQDSSNMNAFRETTTVRRLEGRGFQVRELGAIGLGRRFMPLAPRFGSQYSGKNRREKDRRRELWHKKCVRDGTVVESSPNDFPLDGQR